MSQAILAEKVGLAQNTISLLEIGSRKFLNDQLAENIARALQYDLLELQKYMPIKPSTIVKTERGKLVKARREELGLSFDDFARRMKLTRQKAKRFETGNNPTIRYCYAKPLAKCLRLKPSDLVPFIGQTRKPTDNALGQLVRARRKILGISIVELAKKMHVSRQFIDQIEFGICPLSMSDKIIEQLAKHLKISVNRLNAVRPKRKLKQLVIERKTLLGTFLTKRRLYLWLTQKQVDELSGVHLGATSGIERGFFHGKKLLNKISKTLKCKIPASLIPPLMRRISKKKTQ